MHSFQLPALRTHFSKTPNPPAVTAMVARDQFFDTAEEITVIAAAIYVLSVEYDQLEKRLQDSEHLRRWIILRRQPVVESLLYRVEPPFTAWSEDQILKDVGAMMEELLSKTL